MVNVKTRVMGTKKVKVAICYDFDGTLSPGNMQEHSLLPKLNIKPQDFWKEVENMAKKEKMSKILTYMYLILNKSKGKEQINHKTFKQYGKGINLFNGVKDYFEKINVYAQSKDVELEHYIISSGMKEIIEGTDIKKYFKAIFASEFYYDENGVAVWPKIVIDYTAKTQYLFRINKGILNVWDDTEINKYKKEEDRYIPFNRMIYIGDGETDIPAMKIVKVNGGYSIAVYPPNKSKEKCKELLKQDRAQYIAKADYTENSDLYKLLQKIIDKISIEAQLKKLQQTITTKENS